MTLKLNYVLEEIHLERQKQDMKWGQQNHEMSDWYVILGEEFGEVGKAIGEYKLQHIVPITEYRKELIQTAAVCVAMIQSLDRNGK